MIGHIDCDNKQVMMLFSPEGEILSQMHGCRISTIAKMGMTFTGYEPDGYDKYGVTKFKYQEWYCTAHKLEDAR